MGIIRILKSVKDKECYQIDFGVTANHNTSIIKSSNLNITVLNEYTTLATTINSSGMDYFYINDYLTSAGASLDWDAPFTLTFDLISYMGNCVLYMGSNNYPDVYSKSLSSLGIIQNSKVKLTYDGSEIIVFNNDIEVDRISKDYNIFRVGFQFPIGSKLSYRLLTVYKKIM